MHTLKNSVLFEVMQLPSILLNKYHVQELSQIISLLLKYRITMSLRDTCLWCLEPKADSNHEQRRQAPLKCSATDNDLLRCKLNKN